MKLHVELEQTEWQAILQLVNQGGMLAQMAPLLIGKITEQLQANRLPAAGNGKQPEAPPQV